MAPHARSHGGEPAAANTLANVDGLSFSELSQLVHDFKSPLSLVALETELLHQQLDDGAHVETVRATQRMMLNVDYMDRMVHDLIDSCAIEAGRFELCHAPVDLRWLVENVAARMTTMRAGRRVVVEASDPVIAQLDALRIERVIANLVQNALKYAPENTLVVVRLACSRQWVRISVIDAGPGLEQGELEHLFEEYHRGRTAGAHAGSGLGLYVSKRIVEAHGGSIGVERACDGGCAFYFELPLR